MDLTVQLRDLLDSEILIAGPDRNIWDSVEPIAKKQRYRFINSFKDVQSAVFNIQEELAKVSLMRDFSRLEVFLSKLEHGLLTDSLLLQGTVYLIEISLPYISSKPQRQMDGLDEAVKILQRAGQPDNLEPQVLVKELVEAIKFFQSLQDQVIPEEPLTFDQYESLHWEDGLPCFNMQR